MEMQSLVDSSSDEGDTEVQIPIWIRYPGWTNLVLVNFYCLFGVAFLTTQQDWQPATALYVVVQIVTTIGYGDITVTDEEKIFMTLYVLLGTVLVAKVVNDVSEAVPAKILKILALRTHLKTMVLYVFGEFFYNFFATSQVHAYCVHCPRNCWPRPMLRSMQAYTEWKGFCLAAK